MFRHRKHHSSEEEPPHRQPKTKARVETLCWANLLLDHSRRCTHEGRLVGEISVYTLACSDEAVAPAVTTLSVGDLMAYVDYGGLPEDLVQLVKERLEEKKLDKMLELLEDFHSNSSVSSCISSSSSSSDDEVAVKSTRPRTNFRAIC
ncbi:CBS domain-containing protein CBSX5 [Bienertia sinuspersici]